MTKLTNYRLKKLASAVSVALVAAVSGLAVTAQSVPDFKPPKVVQLPAGQFLRGDLTGVGDRDERPAARVDVDGFSMMAHEVTLMDYYFYLADKIPATKAPTSDQAKLPVTNMNWEDAKLYARWLSQKSGEKWRLPTETEWEYAARAGAVLPFQHDSKSSDLCKAGNVADATGKKANPTWKAAACDDKAAGVTAVGGYLPNAFGLYDMHGNVWEWTSSCYLQYGEKQGLFADCKERVMRGGSYQSPAALARLSNREARMPEDRFRDVGLRLVRD